MTKYSCDIHTTEDWESIALFSDKVSFEAMGAFVAAEFECGNSLSAPCDAIHVIDMDTGEVIFEADVQSVLEEGAHIINDKVVYPPDCYDEPADIDDDCGFDPYEGLFTFDC